MLEFAVVLLIFWLCDRSYMIEVIMVMLLVLTLSSGISVPPAASARNLGFIFDSQLTFSNQVSAVSRACFYHIRDL